MRFAWTRRGIERLVERSLEGDDAEAIATRLGCDHKTVRKMQWELDLVKHRPHRWWSREDIAELKRLFPHLDTGDVARRVGRSVYSVSGMANKIGLNKSAERMHEMGRQVGQRLQASGRSHRFLKGQTPHNKGVKRPGWSAGRMRETQFKKGQKPHTWLPIGSTRLSKKGYLQRKVTDTGYPPHDWIAEHTLLWEKAHGKVPRGHAVCFKNGDKTHVVETNLELISRAELMRRNTIHNLPPELKQVIMLKGVVKRKVREMREEHDRRSA